MNLNIGLGIDVGGTNTDAPLSISKKVFSVAKALTPKEYLATGISDFLNRLDRLLFPKSGLVSLSTILATNSIIEEGRNRVRGFLVGYAPNLYPAAFKNEVVLISGG